MTILKCTFCLLIIIFFAAQSFYAKPVPVINESINPKLLPRNYSGTYKIKLKRGPYLQNVTKNSITVMWSTKVRSRCLVEYRYGVTHKCTAPDNLNVNHKFRINNLPSSAKGINYNIRCVSSIDSLAFYDGAKYTLIGKSEYFSLSPENYNPN